MEVSLIQRLISHTQTYSFGPKISVPAMEVSLCPLSEVPLHAAKIPPSHICEKHSEPAVAYYEAEIEYHKDEIISRISIVLG